MIHFEAVMSAVESVLLGLLQSDQPLKQIDIESAWIATLRLLMLVHFQGNAFFKHFLVGVSYLFNTIYL